ncbi:MAG: Na-K-Cl cotransporter [Veillonellaceae bacterium]|nr:Na-K-Cl cotransporter [Veillonellaceae bacterium]
MEQETEKKGLGTLEGVFTPTILTILGVVMYLRLGWVVGNVGLIETIIIILLAHSITICTALSMASMVSNIEIGAGGAYAIISRSLGFEIGGAIGIPLYFSQAFSVAFYIIGFVELWQSYFPTHSGLFIGVVTWAVLTAISMKSAQLAFRVQYFVLAAIVVSIAAFLAGPSQNPGEVVWLSSVGKVGFWETFAIFFPAVTGILAGVSMSGELKTPRRSIIVGTLTAIFTGLLVYLALAYWFARQATAEALLANPTIILDLAFWRPAIVAGIVGATLSSALSTLVGAPRTLAALAVNRLVPFAGFLGRRADDQEPRNAIFVSSLFSLLVIVAGNLDQLAQLLTMFFLTTYGAINLVVLIEQGSGIISFRPRLKVSILVPLIGFVGCIFTMLLIDKLFTLTTIVVIMIIYSILSRRERKLESPWGDVRGGIFTTVTEWAAQKAIAMEYHPRIWKPSLLVPVEQPEDFARVSRFVDSFLYPAGRLYILSLTDTPHGDAGLNARYDEVLKPILDKKIFMRKTLIHTPAVSFESGLYPLTQVLLNAFLPPNTILFTLSDDAAKQTQMERIYHTMRSLNTGLLFLHIHPKIGFGQERRVNLWLRDKSPNMNLAVLAALQLTRNWEARLTILRVVEEDALVESVTADLELFIEQARLPVDTAVRVLIGDYCTHMQSLRADITIMGMPREYPQMVAFAADFPGTILFVRDSGMEDAYV